MAEESYLWDNPGTGDSPALGYGHTEFMTEMFRMVFNGTGNRGVFPGRLNELEVTANIGVDANPTVDTGEAITYGFWYQSDAPVVPVIANGVWEIVIRCTWAAQTARVAAVAALVQNPGVTYDIPLATVTKAGGVVTVVTDTREYCLFSTVPHDIAVDSNHIQADAVTPAKLEDQDRYISRGAGQFEPDATNPATWINYGSATHPYRDTWQFADAATNGVWSTFRVPADFTGANITIQVRVGWLSNVSADVVWGWSIWSGAAGAALANAAGTLTRTHASGNWWGASTVFTLTTVAATTGDIFHTHLYRNGAAGADTSTDPMYPLLAEFEYTADS